MLCIAGQTAGTIGLNFFVDIHGWPGGVKIFFHGQHQDLQLIINNFFLNFMKTSIFKASSNQNVRKFDFV